MLAQAVVLIKLLWPDCGNCAFLQAGHLGEQDFSATATPAWVECPGIGHAEFLGTAALFLCDCEC